MKRKHQHIEPEVFSNGAEVEEVECAIESGDDADDMEGVALGVDLSPTPTTKTATEVVPTATTTKLVEEYDPDTTFALLGLDARLLQGIAKLGFTNPTAIQAKAIPLALEGMDILARAKTGSGKTVAYLLPILQAVLKKKETISSSDTQGTGPSGLLLVPTRELADQVHKATEKLAAFCGKSIKAVNLAQNMSEQVQQLLLAESPDIVVATPSRVLTHINLAPQLIVPHLTHLVIDEADLVLSYGYEDDLTSVSKSLPKGIQTFLMSATLTSEVETLKKLFLRNPVILKLQDDELQDGAGKGGVTQYCVRCGEDEKFLLLYVIFKLKLIKGKTIIFVADIDRCYRIKLFLEQFGIRSCVLNSELPVNSRLHIVEEFNKNVYDIIIATDENEIVGDEEDDIDVPESTTTTTTTITPQQPPPKKRTKKHPRRPRPDKEYGVSRGIDFHQVSCVLNFDLPSTPRSYTHRIGRTARAGNTGMAMSFVIPKHLFGKNKHTSNPACVNDEAVLAKIQKSQLKKLQKTKPVSTPTTLQDDQQVEEPIKPYHFPPPTLAPFRYRFEDALRAITRSSIREARTKELRLELLKSEKLKRHFEENPDELLQLRHDTGLLRAARVQPHLKHVPDYLLPKVEGGGVGQEGNVGFVGLKKATENRVRRARIAKRKGGRSGASGAGKRVGNPLKTFRGRK